MKIHSVINVDVTPKLDIGRLGNSHTVFDGGCPRARENGAIGYPPESDPKDSRHPAQQGEHRLLNNIARESGGLTFEVIAKLVQ